jgi:hypothetical protein
VTGEPPLGVSVKLEGVIVVESIAREKVADTVVVTPTPVAPAAGDVDVTVGAAIVVKLQVNALESGVPSEAFAPVVIVAV